jgi:hypothetical protein
MRMVDDRPYLHNLILHILDSDWYKARGAEQLPDGELRKAFRKRTSSSSASSPFSAFFSPKQPYICFLCPEGPQPHRTLERALGHARYHFNFKPVLLNEKGYTNLNTKNDQERRARKPVKFCIPWSVYFHVQIYNTSDSFTFLLAQWKQEDHSTELPATRRLQGA